MANQFVKGWHLVDTVGEGRFGEVKLLMNKFTKEMVACKVLIVDTPEKEKQVRKELMIHKNANHKSIIEFLGNRRDDKTEFIFLKYATGGELFDHIEPDRGMDRAKAFRLFCELLDGVQYLHQKGIVHRDIKPENLLLDANGNLKMADFGLSTLFRLRGQERPLNQCCGSIPYMAPEVLAGVLHKAEPIDIWSCGIVLVAMLTGELPWQQAIPELSVSYKNWASGKCMVFKNPWAKVDNTALSLIKCILEPIPGKRFTIKKIQSHRWFGKPPTKEVTSDLRQIKRQCVGFLSQPTLKCHNSASQTNRLNSSMFDNENNDPSDEFNSSQLPGFNSNSQPINIDNLFISSQMDPLSSDSELSQGGDSSQPGARLYMSLVRRMTRFITKCDFAKTLTLMGQAFSELNYAYKKCSHGQFSITINNQIRQPLVFKVTLNELAKNKVLVDFRLAKGDGIEFKRQFLIIKTLLSSHIETNLQFSSINI